MLQKKMLGATGQLKITGILVHCGIQNHWAGQQQQGPYWHFCLEIGLFSEVKIFFKKSTKIQFNAGM